MTIAIASDKRKPSLWVLIAMSWVAPMGINISLPSIPTIEKALNAPYGQVTLIISLYLAASALCQLVIGPLSDRYGRRPVILTGFLIATLAGVVCTIAPSIEVLVVARIVQGGSACVGIVLARAIVRDVYDRDQSASIIGYVTMGMAIAPMIAPLTGGLIDDFFGWRVSYALLTATTAFVALSTYLFLPETSPMSADQTVRQLVSEFFALLKIRLFWLYALATTLSAGVYFSFLGGAPLVSAEVLGLSATGYGVWFVFVATGYMCGNYVSGRFAEAMGVSWMCRTGCFVAVLATSLLTLGYALFGLTILGLFGPVFILGIANGMTMPSGIAGAVSVRPKLAGTAAGLTSSMQIGFGALMTSVCGLSVDRAVGPANPLPLVAICLALAVAAYVTILLTPHEKKAPQDTATISN